MSDGVIIPISYIERKPDSEHYRIVHKGVTVTFLATLINHPDWSVERICANYDLTPAEVHAAWAFYYDHQAEIDALLAKSPPAPTPEEIERYARVQARFDSLQDK